FRGPDFAPLLFKLHQGTSEQLRDSDGEPIWTVTASAITDEEKAREEDEDRARQDKLLAAMFCEPGASLSHLSDNLGWNKSTTNRVMRARQSYKLVEKDRSNRYILTASGKKAAEATAPKAKLTPEQENLF